MYNQRSQDLQIQRQMPSVNVFTEKHASYTKRLQSMDPPGEWNENSETIELPVTDSICPPELLSSDRG